MTKVCTCKSLEGACLSCYLCVDAVGVLLMSSWLNNMMLEDMSDGVCRVLAG